MVGFKMAGCLIVFVGFIRLMLYLAYTSAVWSTLDTNLWWVTVFPALLVLVVYIQLIRWLAK